jgi:membrane protein implicated in regulation of membrane protease activity
MVFLLILLIVLLAGVAWPWSAVLLAVAVVLETVEIVLLRRWAGRLERRRRHVDPDEELIGSIAEVVRACRPDGQVRVRGELWQAACAAGADEGDLVRVDAVHELDLVVSKT